MTRKEAIHDIEVMLEYFSNEYNGVIPVCLEYALKVLKEQEETNGSSFKD